MFYAAIISFEKNVWEENPTYIAKPCSNSNYWYSRTPSALAALPFFTDNQICGHSYSLWNIKRVYISQSTVMHLIFFVFVTFWWPEHTVLHLLRPQGPPVLFTPGHVIIWYFEKRSQNIDSPLFKLPLSLLALSLSSVGRLILVTCPPPFAPLGPYLNHCCTWIQSYAPGLWGSLPTSLCINDKPKATAFTTWTAQYCWRSVRTWPMLMLFEYPWRWTAFSGLVGWEKKSLSCHSKPSPSPLVPKPALFLTLWSKAVPTLPIQEPLSMNSTSSAPHISASTLLPLRSESEASRSLLEVTYSLGISIPTPPPQPRPTSSPQKACWGRCLWFLQGLMHSSSPSGRGGGMC